MAKLSKIQGDPEKEEKGVWIPFALDIECKIARMNNRNYNKMVRSLTKPYTKGFRTDGVPDDKTEEIALKAAAKHILVDWRNLEDDDGTPIPYSYEKSYEILSDPKNRDLLDFILVESRDIANYRNEALEDESGN